MDNPDLFSVEKVNFNKDGNQMLKTKISANGFLQDAVLKTTDNEGNEQIFVLDDYAKLQKIDELGRIISHKNSSHFGKKIIEEDAEDIKKGRLIDVNEDVLLVFLLTQSNDTKFVLVNKKTGEVLDRKLDFKGKFNNLHLFEKTGNKLTFIVEKTDNSLQSLTVGINNNQFVNTNQLSTENIGNSDQIKRKIFFNSEDQIVLALDQNNKLISFEIQKIKEKLSFKKSSLEQDFGQTYETISDHIKNNHQDFVDEVFGKEYNNHPLHESEPFSKFIFDRENLGEIILFKKIEDKFLLFNKRGMVNIFDSNMKILKTKFLLKADYFKDIIQEHKQFYDKYNNTKISKWKLDRIFKNLKIFAKDDNKIWFLLNKKFKFNWWNNWSFITEGKILEANFVDMLNEAKQEVSISENMMEHNAENPDPKFDYDFRIVIKPNNSSNYLIFNNYGDLWVFNSSNFNEEFIPQLVLKYDGEIIQREENLYDLSENNNWFIEEFQDKNLSN